MSNQYFVKNAFGISNVCVLLNGKNRSNEIYRLRHILWHDKKLKQVGILCLETNFLHIEPNKNVEEIEGKLIAEMNNFSADFFIEKLNSMKKTKNLLSDFLSYKPDSILIKKFDEISNAGEQKTKYKRGKAEIITENKMSHPYVHAHI